MTEHVFDETVFRAQFPELSSPLKYPSTLLNAMFDVAKIRLTPYDNWLICGNRLQYALNLMTAHVTALRSAIAGGDGEGWGIVQNASEGSVSVSMAVPRIKDGFDFWMMQTPYGQELLAFLKTLTAQGFYFGGKPEGSAIRDVGGSF